MLLPLLMISEPAGTISTGTITHEKINSTSLFPRQNTEMKSSRYYTRRRYCSLCQEWEIPRNPTNEFLYCVITSGVTALLAAKNSAQGIMSTGRCSSGKPWNLASLPTDRLLVRWSISYSRAFSVRCMIYGHSITQSIQHQVLHCNPRHQVASWVVQAWDRITEDLWVKAWTSCGYKTNKYLECDKVNDIVPYSDE